MSKQKLDKYWDFCSWKTKQHYKYRGKLNVKIAVKVCKKIDASECAKNTALKTLRVGHFDIYKVVNGVQKKGPFRFGFDEKKTKQYILELWDGKMGIWRTIKGKAKCEGCDKILSEKYVQKVTQGNGKYYAGVFCKKCWLEFIQRPDMQKLCFTCRKPRYECSC
jgi:hypothetical protein